MPVQKKVWKLIECTSHTHTHTHTHTHIYIYIYIYIYREREREKQRNDEKKLIEQSITLYSIMIYDTVFVLLCGYKMLTGDED